jgi:hypothetical protein
LDVIVLPANSNLPSSYLYSLAANKANTPAIITTSTTPTNTIIATANNNKKIDNNTNLIDDSSRNNGKINVNSNISSIVNKASIDEIKSSHNNSISQTNASILPTSTLPSSQSPESTSSFSNSTQAANSSLAAQSILSSKLTTNKNSLTSLRDSFKLKPPSTQSTSTSASTPTSTSSQTPTQTPTPTPASVPVAALASSLLSSPSVYEKLNFAKEKMQTQTSVNKQNESRVDSTQSSTQSINFQSPIFTLSSSPSLKTNASSSAMSTANRGPLSGGMSALFYSFLKNNPSTNRSSSSIESNYDSKPDNQASSVANTLIAQNQSASPLQPSNNSTNNNQMKLLQQTLPASQVTYQMDRQQQQSEHQAQPITPQSSASLLAQKKLKKLQESLATHYSKEQLNEMGIVIPGLNSNSIVEPSPPRASSEIASSSGPNTNSNSSASNLQQQRSQQQKQQTISNNLSHRSSLDANDEARANRASYPKTNNSNTNIYHNMVPSLTSNDQYRYRPAHLSHPHPFYFDSANNKMGSALLNKNYDLVENSYKPDKDNSTPIKSQSSSSSTILSPISTTSLASNTSTSSSTSSNSPMNGSNYRTNENELLKAVAEAAIAANKTSPHAFTRYIESVHKALHGNLKDNVNPKEAKKANASNQKQQRSSTSALIGRHSSSSSSSAESSIITTTPVESLTNLNEPEENKASVQQKSFKQHSTPSSSLQQQQQQMPHTVYSNSSPHTLAQNLSNLLSVSKRFVGNRRNILEESLFNPFGKHSKQDQPQARQYLPEQQQNQTRSLYEPNEEDPNTPTIANNKTSSPFYFDNNNNTNPLPSHFYMQQSSPRQFQQTQQQQQQLQQQAPSSGYKQLQYQQSKPTLSTSSTSSINRSIDSSNLNSPNEIANSNMGNQRASSVGLSYNNNNNTSTASLFNLPISPRSSSTSATIAQNLPFNHLNRASYKGECKRIMSRANMETVAERAARFEEIDPERYNRMKNKIYELDQHQQQQLQHEIELQKQQQQQQYQKLLAHHAPQYQISFANSSSPNNDAVASYVLNHFMDSLMPMSATGTNSVVVPDSNSDYSANKRAMVNIQFSKSRDLPRHTADEYKNQQIYNEPGSIVTKFSTNSSPSDKDNQHYEANAWKYEPYIAKYYTSKFINYN